MFKTGDRVRVKHNGEYEGMEGTIVAFLPSHLGRGVQVFFINFDNPPDTNTYFSHDLIHQGGQWEALDVELLTEYTIGELADILRVDPYEIAAPALQEVEDELRLERMLNPEEK